MQKITLYTAGCIGNPKNCIYNNEVAVASLADFRKAVSHDHVFAKYKHNYRSASNFVNSDCVAMECDNDQTENCLVVCDSYGLPVVPMLTENYKQIHYYDPRKFDRASVGYSVSEMIEKYEIQDIYVIVGDVHVFNYESVLNLFNNHFGK